MTVPLASSVPPSAVAISWAVMGGAVGGRIGEVVVAAGAGVDRAAGGDDAARRDPYRSTVGRRREDLVFHDDGLAVHRQRLGNRLQLGGLGHLGNEQDFRRGEHLAVGVDQDAARALRDQRALVVSLRKPPIRMLSKPSSWAMSTPT